MLEGDKLGDLRLEGCVAAALVFDQLLEPTDLRLAWIGISPASRSVARRRSNSSARCW